MRFFRRASLVSILLWCAFGFLLVVGFRESNIIGGFSGISLRYETPINGLAAHRARQYSITNGETFWLTFWQEGSAFLSVGRGEVYSNSISFSGDAALVWPAEYTAGSAPGSLDNNGVAVSEGLAHRLWGSTDIVGQGVEVNGEKRAVRGVFRGDANLVLLSFGIEDTSHSWSGIELSGGEAHATRGDAEIFALASGLGRPDYILMGGAMAFARFMSIAPLFIPIIYALVTIAKFIRRHYSWFGVPLLIAGLIVFAVLLPALLERLPGWVIPTHWSDFSFWSSLLRQGGEGLREFLSADPGLRDVELRMHLLRLMGISFLSIFCGLAVCFRWSMSTPEERVNV